MCVFNEMGSFLEKVLFYLIKMECQEHKEIIDQIMKCEVNYN